MRRLVRAGALLGIVVAVVAVFLVFFDPRVLADRSMRAPAEACPRLELGPRPGDAVVARALEEADLDAAAIVDITMGRPDGPLMELGGWQVAVVHATAADGTEHRQEVWCTGVGSHERPWCNEDPPLQLRMGANHDTPACADGSIGTDAPRPCVTPIALDPAAVAAARPLRIPRLDIRLAVGSHDIELGRALLPNGYLDTAEFALADPAPDGVVMRDGVRLVVEPADPARPPMANVYERGTVPGVEEVIVRLRFDVVAAPAGAVLEVRDVLVR